ncbi:MAG: WYL domain-containing protein [Microcoleus sp. PH2017_10_PVI_O_A]|uniref:helix-turn-helix transcriptional regulator n=1 Tax=unclassified Microcoleus TaxID=2642155 RepID=UPI001D70DCF9|nr:MULTISPECIES: WYL domain-containing protein [unclassified Microcoleus]TAE79721.1 MAG: WYL domain-containing protein [Oscillatoriales cyanobacterium]MCC3407536.1 WYL domain-containing protein [Microcoleus sp. PH2017_10_PVI_O_A]MCC3460165.1 WYL domain-containing protein [Microcoleus sp. PH2017_11_PCY_U_A]MCC3480105.1 WYL domain-containing protein [Microcoleus sp. PH2017_12_PCY_D_A]MCC3529625.1 WYL domain-containing protein [Microcoleus sp. PH2017_21_RUC_O_A]
MVRKKETITLSIPSGTKEQLESIALRLNIKWGKSPSVSGLLVAIAQQQVAVGEPFALNPSQVAALQQATKLLVDSGGLANAEILAALMLDRGKLDAPLRQSLLQLVSQPNEGWRPRADQLINTQQPFRLLYRNNQGEELEYTVRYAQVSFEEKRFYLNIWCEETDDIKNPDYPELIHNRCLRFDNIKAIVPISGQWRCEGLDYLKVYLHFRGGMIKAYERRVDKDIQDEVLGEGKTKVRQVVRHISNPFWLIREVFRYGEDCVIVSPQKVRDRFQQKLMALCRQYDIEIRD